jgi:ABC-type uncharacterized transport system substrate-binding protein
LVQLRLDVIVAEGTAATRAAKTVTQTIPIVMATSTDPVGNSRLSHISSVSSELRGCPLCVDGVNGSLPPILSSTCLSA